jgi:Cdc6-like AAA superfamily ATPase
MITNEPHSQLDDVYVAGSNACQPSVATAAPASGTPAATASPSLQLAVQLAVQPPIVPLDLKAAYVEVAAMLSPREVPSNLVGGSRKAAVRTICNVLRRQLATNICVRQTVYVFERPGLGKTAVVKEALRALRADVCAQELSPFYYIEFNCYGFDGSWGDFCQRIVYLLWGQRLVPRVAVAALQGCMRTSTLPYLVLFLDEFDGLTGKHALLYNLFDLSGECGSRLIVLCASTDVGLLEKLPRRILSRMGAIRVCMPPYTRDELVDILLERVRRRVSNLLLFSPPLPRAASSTVPSAIRIVAAEVAARSGDARLALELLRRAVEIARSRDAPFVESGDARAALHEVFCCTFTMQVRSGCTHEKIFLTALACLEMGAAPDDKGDAVQTFSLHDIALRHEDMCRTLAIEMPCFGSLIDIACRLGEQYLIYYDPGRRGQLMRINLRARSARDVWEALKGDLELRKVLETYGPPELFQPQPPLPSREDIAAEMRAARVDGL